MSFPFQVGSGSTSGFGITTHTLPTPPPGSAGDLLLILFLCEGVETPSFNNGYAVLYTGHSPNNDLTLCIAYKTAGGSELTPAATTAGACDSVSILRRIGGWSGIALGTAATGTSNTATVVSSTASGGAGDRLWVSAMGAENSQTGIPTPGLSNELSECQLALSILSGTLDSSLATVTMGNYSLTGVCDWIAVPVIVHGPGVGGGGGVTIDADTTLEPFTSYASLLTIPDNTVRMEFFTTTAQILVGTPITLDSFESAATLFTRKKSGMAKVYHGGAWVAAVPKAYVNGVWEEMVSVKVHDGVDWVEVI